MSLLMNALAAIPSIVAAVAAFAFLIVIHELGHALAARAVGMRIVRFSIGYGKVLNASLQKAIDESQVGKTAAEMTA